MPLSSSAMVNKEEVLDLLTRRSSSLPDELRQARWLLKEREEYLAKMRVDGRRDPRSGQSPGRADGAAHRGREGRGAPGPPDPRGEPRPRPAACATSARTSATRSWPASRSCSSERSSSSVPGRAKLQATSRPRPEADAGARSGAPVFFDQDQWSALTSAACACPRRRHAGGHVATEHADRARQGAAPSSGIAGGELHRTMVARGLRAVDRGVPDGDEVDDRRGARVDS